jgi:uncharacterized protein (TIGR00730 family)
MPFSVCVYCGSRSGTRPEYAQVARRLGEDIGRRGWQLVYGGGRVGLMGELANAALAAGAAVVGVIPESLMRLEVGHRDLTELHVVRTMHERKQLMAERAHAFIALPGGIGTFEELFEVWTWRHLEYHSHPIGLLDVSGYYDALEAFLEHAVEEGFLSPMQMSMLHRNSDPAALLNALYEARATSLHTPPMDRI